MVARRDFLKTLGLIGVAVAAPKIIFDCGANLYKFEPRGITIVREYDYASIYIAHRTFELNGQQYRHGITIERPRFLTYAANAGEVLCEAEETFSALGPDDWNNSYGKLFEAAKVSLDIWERSKRQQILQGARA